MADYRHGDDGVTHPIGSGHKAYFKNLVYVDDAFLPHEATRKNNNRSRISHGWD